MLRVHHRPVDSHEAAWRILDDEEAHKRGRALVGPRAAREHHTWGAARVGDRWVVRHVQPCLADGGEDMPCAPVQMPEPGRRRV